MTERAIHSQNGDTYYWVSRHGNPFAKCVVFLHGLSADHTLFDHQMAYFSKKYTIIVWDAPAHGKSRPYSGFTYAAAAAELCTILDAEGIEKAVLAGQGMGSLVAQAFTEKYPQKTTALIGIGALPFDTSFYSGRDRWFFKQAGWISRLYSEQKLREKMARSCTCTQEAYQAMLDSLAPLSVKEIFALLKLGFSGFMRELHDIPLSCPVMLLVGEQDNVRKVLQYGQRWSEKCKYPLHIIKNAAHNANFDNPDVCNSLMEEFLSALSETV